jgi:hypothetical protein
MRSKMSACAVGRGLIPEGKERKRRSAHAHYPAVLAVLSVAVVMGHQGASL